MNVSEKLTTLASALRTQYGTDDKYTIDDMVKGISGLKVQNLVDPGQSYDTSVDKQSWKLVNGLDIDGWNKLIGKAITISFDLEWSNYKPDTKVKNRIGMEWELKHESHEETWANAWYCPQTSDGKEHVVNTITILNDKIVGIGSKGFFNQVNPECTFKATNFKIVVNPMDG